MEKDVRKTFTSAIYGLLVGFGITFLFILVAYLWVIDSLYPRVFETVWVDFLFEVLFFRKTILLMSALLGGLWANYHPTKTTRFLILLGGTVGLISFFIDIFVSYLFWRREFFELSDRLILGGFQYVFTGIAIILLMPPFKNISENQDFKKRISYVYGGCFILQVLVAFIFLGGSMLAVMLDGYLQDDDGIAVAFRTIPAAFVITLLTMILSKLIKPGKLAQWVMVLPALGIHLYMAFNLLRDEILYMIFGIFVGLWAESLWGSFWGIFQGLFEGIETINILLFFIFVSLFLLALGLLARGLFLEFTKDQDRCPNC